MVHTHVHRRLAVEASCPSQLTGLAAKRSSAVDAWLAACVGVVAAWLATHLHAQSYRPVPESCAAGAPRLLGRVPLQHRNCSELQRSVPTSCACVDALQWNCASVAASAASCHRPCLISDQPWAGCMRTWWCVHALRQFGYMACGALCLPCLALGQLL